MARRVLAVLAVLALGAAGSAAARAAEQSGDGLIAGIAAIAAEQTMLLQELRANAKRKREIDAQYAALKPETDRIDKAAREATAFCRGTFDAAEYRRRKAICDRRQAENDRQRSALAKRRGPIEAADAARLQAAKALQATYAAQLARLKAIEAALARHPVLGAAWTGCQSASGLAARGKCLAERWAASAIAAVKAEQEEFTRRGAAWLRRQQDEVRDAVAQGAAWGREVLRAIRQTGVPGQELRPKSFADAQPGDVLLLLPEKGFAPTRLIPPADWIYRVAEHWASGESFREAVQAPKSPVSHAVTVVKSVNGHLLILDHTTDGSRILSKADFERKYGHRGMFAARPANAVDGRALWQAAREAALQRKSDYGVVRGKVVCSERAGVAVATATGISNSNRRFGPIDITPGDFFDQQANGKYFVITPMAH
jgi:hypothetical protein